MANPSDPTRRLVAVVGATATGKSELAVRLAEAFDGEVVNTDAYAIYRGMDVGTAKPDAGLRTRVPHHLIDVADPDEPLTLARYLDAANDVLEAIWARGKLPVLAGGSGQYVWALIEGWQVPHVPADHALRDELEALAATEGATAVQAKLAAVDPEAAARLDPKNVRRLVRALELVMRTGLPLSACQTRHPIDADVLILGLDVPRDELHRRLDARAELQCVGGFVEEVQRLRDEGYGDSSPVRGGVGYKEIGAYLDGEYDLEEALRRTKNANHRLVRRQHAWFKPGDSRIHWIEATDGVYKEARGAVQEWLDVSMRDE